MRHGLQQHLAAFLLGTLLFPASLVAQADVDDIPSADLTVDGKARMRYFLIGPKEGTKAPKKGYGLVVIMPGGNGGENFHTFVKRIYKHALSDKYIVAQPVSVTWTPQQQVVWPTRKLKVDGQTFSTEKFVETVIKDVKKRHDVDARRIFTLSWSSSGPAAYAIALQKKTAVTGSFISMSVFKPNYLPSLKRGKDRNFYIEHSPQDAVCPYRMAEQARDSLKEEGAKVKFSKYDGGHGWRGDVYGRLRRGFEWLEKQAPKKVKKAKKTKKEKKE